MIDPDQSVFDVNSRAQEGQEGTTQAREAALMEQMTYDHLRHGQELTEEIRRQRDEDE